MMCGEAPIAQKQLICRYRLSVTFIYHCLPAWLVSCAMFLCCLRSVSLPFTQTEGSDPSQAQLDTCFYSAVTWLTQSRQTN